MKVEDYRAIRQTGKDLTSKIFKFAIDSNKKDLTYAAKLLGFWSEHKLVFDSDQEFDVLTEFLIFEKFNQNIPVVRRFDTSNPELTDREKENMNGILNYYASLFEIQSIDSSNNTLVLIDLLDPIRKKFTLMDIGLSQSSVVGVIFYTRLLPIQDIYMTSGVSFAFENINKDKLLGIISLTTFKNRKKLNTTEMFILMHKKHQHFGLKIKTL